MEEEIVVATKISGLHHSSLPRLRKEMSAALETLIDTLRNPGAANLVLAKPPLTLPAKVRATPLSVGALPEPDPAEQYPLGQRWPDLKLQNICFAYLECVVEGEVDERIGFPSTLLADMGIAGTDAAALSNCCFLTLPAPSFLFIPPMVAHRSGTQAPWERHDLKPPRSTIFWVRFPDNQAQCHLSTMRDARYYGQMPMRIVDAQLMDLWRLLTTELEARGPEGNDIAEALLLALLLRLRRGLLEPSAEVADGLSFWIPSSMPPPKHPVGAHEALDEACSYIQSNLHTPLSPARIAQHVELSPTQLRRIFRNRLDTTVMEYVTRRRLEAAQIYLSEHALSIAEISNLVGYPYPEHFSRVFHREMGMTPTKFRRRNRKLL